MPLEESDPNDQFGWHRNKPNGESTYIGPFDVDVHSKIHKFNRIRMQWEVEEFELQVAYTNGYYNKLKHSDSFTMEAKDLLSKKPFSVKLFKVTDNDNMRMPEITNDDEQFRFIATVCKESPPRNVYGYNKYGIIDHKGHTFFLAKNILIPLDRPADKSVAVKPEQSTGMFEYPVKEGEDTFWVKPGNINPAPEFLDLPEADENGRYHIYSQLLTGRQLEIGLSNLRERYADTFAGDIPKHKPEGYLLFDWLLSHLFMDDIYEVFNHLIYIYIYGKPSVGKGVFSQFMLNFYGQSFTDVESNPTLKSAENKLMNHSKIPVFMDEYKPGESKIVNQIFNMWYEKRPRGVSASYDRSKNQNNTPETQIAFMSNYFTNEDHFKSRCLFFEYTKEKRGEQRHVWWFEKNKKEVQRIFLSLIIQKYNAWDRVVFRKELKVMKRYIATEVNEVLDKRAESEGMNFNIKDRQIEMMAALCCVDNFVNSRFFEDNLRQYHSRLMVFNDNNIKSSDDDEYELDTLEETVKSSRKTQVFYYAVKMLARAAEKDITKSPLQQFLSTIEVISDRNELPIKAFQFNDRVSVADGDLKIAWTKLWDAYESDRVGRDMVSEDEVKAEIETLDKNGKAKTHMINSVPQHGFRISRHQLTTSWYRAFGKTKKAAEMVNLQSSESNDTESDEPKEPESTDVNDELPF